MKRPTQIEDDLATSLKRKRAIERLRLTPLPVIDEPGPPPVLAIDIPDNLAIDIDIPDDFRAPTPKAKVIQTPIDNDITDRDYQSLSPPGSRQYHPSRKQHHVPTDPYLNENPQYHRPLLRQCQPP